MCEEILDLQDHLVPSTDDLCHFSLLAFFISALLQFFSLLPSFYLCLTAVLLPYFCCVLTFLPYSLLSLKKDLRSKTGCKHFCLTTYWPSHWHTCTCTCKLVLFHPSGKLRILIELTFHFPTTSTLTWGKRNRQTRVRVSRLPLVLSLEALLFLRHQTLLEMKFCRTLFYLVSVCLMGFLNLLPDRTHFDIHVVPATHI